ncbi:MAG: serine/threonine-protein kinase [Kofleriaceae bacterium]
MSEKIPSGPDFQTMSDDDSQPATRPDRIPTGMHESGMLGRFNILDILGSGGMGVVLAAYDPQLDRKVAIKVLRTRGLTATRREKEAARLLREARSMAQLSHPHVVTVYEAGTIDDRVFIAMEYIPGQTLRSWLAERKRTAAEILEVYVKAGRGLAAGHHAGLIHRDFKPDNVLVGHDGRVRVIDFGLARPSRTQLDTPSSDDVDPDEPQPTPFPGPASQLTTAGTLFGTPMYMAPEQHQKVELDARTDQFAFCVALFESLYGRMPFPAQSYGELYEAVVNGKLAPPPAVDPPISTRVHEAVVRGLQADPDARFPSMDALLDELEPPAKRNRKYAAVAAGVAAIAAAAITLVVVQMTQRKDAAAADAPCLGGEARLASVWDGATKTRVKAAFLASHRSHAPDTYDRVEGSLDRYAADWVERRRDVCAATEIRKEQSEAAFDLRMKCLGERLDELHALTTVFANADGTVTDRAIVAARDLPHPVECTTLAVGGIQPTPAQATQLAALEPEFAEILANQAAGRVGTAVAKATPLLARAQQIGYAPFEAKVTFRLAVAQSGDSKPAEAEKMLRRALELATRTGSDTLVANIWTFLIWVSGHQLGNADAIGYQLAAETAIQRVDGDAAMRSELQYYLGSAYFAKNDYKHAATAFEAALALQTQASGDTYKTAQILNSIGGAYLRLGNIFGAKKAFERALEIDTAELGPKHPETVLPLANLGSLAQALGMFDDATKYQLRALAMLEETYGPDHQNVGLTIYSLAVSANGREDYKAGVPLYERALHIFEKVSPDSLNVGLALIGLADCREEIGDAKQAVIDGERALAVMKDTKDPVQLAMARYILAKALWSAGQRGPRARQLAAEARKGFEAGGLAAAAGLLAVDKWFEKINK